MHSECLHNILHVFMYKTGVFVWYWALQEQCTTEKIQIYVPVTLLIYTQIYSLTFFLHYFRNHQPKRWLCCFFSFFGVLYLLTTYRISKSVYANIYVFSYTNCFLSSTLSANWFLFFYQKYFQHSMCLLMDVFLLNVCKNICCYIWLYENCPFHKVRRIELLTKLAGPG